VLETQGLTVRFGDVPAVDDVSLALPAGETLAVLGPSGCGKSTLLRAVAGLEPAYTGRVCFDDRDLAGVPTHKRGFALMFQDGQLFAHLSVAGNVGYPLRLRRVRGREAAAEIAQLLELVGLPGMQDRTVTSLSGGERQRVALARALAVKPRLLLLDEPLSALDRSLRERLAADLRRILVAAGTTALLVTHDQEEAFAVADRMALMRRGRLVQSGTVEDVWRAPADADSARFLGYATVLEGEAARAVLRGAGAHGQGPLALRRSAVRVDDTGPLQGTVTSARQAPDLVRLTVLLDDGVGELHAVADGPATPAVGERVRMVVDLTRTAQLSTPGPQRSTS
jgi:thiamine transport system ATP-binding protein